MRSGCSKPQHYCMQGSKHVSSTHAACCTNWVSACLQGYQGPGGGARDHCCIVTNSRSTYAGAWWRPPHVLQASTLPEQLR